MFGTEVSFDGRPLRLTTRPSHRISCHEGTIVKQSLRLQRSACTSQKIDYPLLIFARDALHWLTEHTSTVHYRCALHFSSWVLNPYPSKHYLWSRKGLDGANGNRRMIGVFEAPGHVAAPSKFREGRSISSALGPSPVLACKRWRLHSQCA